MKKIIVLILLLNNIHVYSQGANKIIGKYADDLSELTLFADSIFDLKTPDYVYPFKADIYHNKGEWVSSGDIVTLNPLKEKRQPTVSMTEGLIRNYDSVKIKIIYLTELYENEKFVSKVPADFNMVTLYLNKRGNFQNFVHKTVNGATASLYAFSSKDKKPIMVDTTNKIVLPKQSIDRLGIYTYGFTKTIELVPQNPNSNYFEITITQPIDKERMPRNKKIIIKNQNAYFYERNGKILTSGLILNGLKLVR